MKNYRNLFLLTVLSICSFLLVGVVTVNASVGYANKKPVCDPADAAAGLKPGDSTTCYVIGNASHASTDSSVHGFMVRMYTTDGLIFDSVQPYVAGTKAVSYVAAAASDQKNTITLDGGTNIEVTCKYDTQLKAEIPDWQINTEKGDEFRCAFYYSSGTSNAFTPAAAKPGTDIQGLTGTDNGLMVIGKVIAHIDQNAKNESRCGELCVFAKEAESTSSYANLNEGTGTYMCAEVHYTADSVATNTPTGAFVSYAILAAGALIAVSAVAIAKKHNKIYKV